MKILVINAGSSSLKFQLIDMDDESVKAKGLVERIKAEIRESPFHGEGYRKVWAGLRDKGIRTSPARTLRLMRENALSALPMTKGARLMLSTPPAIISVASPALMARAAVPTASIPEPHRRLMVVPGNSTGKPASRLAMWATLRLSSPAWLTHP